MNWRICGVSYLKQVNIHLNCLMATHLKRPCLTQLARQIKRGNPTALDAFCRARRGNAKINSVGMHAGRSIRTFPKPLVR
jgi:hypothetical protein